MKDIFRIEYTREDQPRAVQVNKLSQARDVARVLKDRGHVDISIVKIDNKGNKELVQVVNPAIDPDIEEKQDDGDE